jgi:hypothetical protein
MLSLAHLERLSHLSVLGLEGAALAFVCQLLRTVPDPNALAAIRVSSSAADLQTHKLPWLAALDGGLHAGRKYVAQLASLEVGLCAAPGVEGIGFETVKLCMPMADSRGILRSIG